MPRSPRCGAVQCADVVVAQRVEDVLQLAAGRGDHPDVAAAAGGDPVPDARPGVVLGRICTDSTAAQRTSREPCLVIRPRCTWVSDSWCFGVSPAQQVSCAALANRVTSPISATNTAPRTGPIPGMVCTAV